MSLPALVVLLASLSVSAQTPAVKVTVDIASGATLTGERNFRVLVSTDEVVTKVEMYVGKDLRGEESSTPYRFTLDTINEKDGPLDLKWVAYTDQSHKGTTTIHVNVDNGISQGADAHVQTGLKLLQDGKSDAAVTQGRIALKIDKKSDSARFLLARAYLQQGVFDKAQKYVQDVVDDEPKNLEALDITASITLKEAFTVMSKGDQTTDTLASIGTLFKTAVDSRRKFIDAKFDALPAPTDDASTMVYVDGAISALRFSAGINVLEPLFKKAPSRADYADRLAYCQMRDGRLTDALNTLQTLKNVGRNNSDAYAQALTALVMTYLGDNNGALAAMEDAVLNDSSNVGVLSAQASIALKHSEISTLSKTSTALGQNQGDRTEVNYLLAALYNRMGKFTEERHYFELCLLAEPLNYDMYLEEGNAALALVNSKVKKEDADFQYAYAELMFQMALEAKNDSYQALAGLAIVDGLRGKSGDALKFAQAAADAQPNSAMAQVTLSAAAHFEGRAIHPHALPGDDKTKQAEYAAALKRANDLDLLSVAAMEKAGKIDPNAAGGRGVPDMNEAYKFFVHNGRSPVISRP